MMKINTNKSYYSTSKTLYLLVSNGMNNEIIKLIDAINEASPTWNLEGFIFENRNSIDPEIYKIKDGSDIYIANNLDRSFVYYEKILSNLFYSGFKMCNLIHPSVDMSRVNIGTGCIIQNGTSIGSGSTIGSYVTIRLNALLSNNVYVANNVFIGPNCSIGNNVHLQKNCFVGIGSVISDGVIIGENSTVGAGAIVTEHVPPNTTVIGVPAKPLR